MNLGAIIQQLYNNTLSRLYLDNSQIGGGQAEAIAEALKINTSLQILSLNNNRIGDEETKKIAQALQVGFLLIFTN